MKATLVFFLALATLEMAGQAGILSRGIITRDQDFIRQATDSAVFILQQEYVLLDTVTGIRYPMHGKTYFGKTFQAALLADSMLWTNARLFTPHLVDTAYIHYNENYGYIYELSTLMYRPLYSDHFDTLKFVLPETDNALDSLWNHHAMVCIRPLNIAGKGLDIRYQTTDTTGWVLLVHTDESLTSNDSAALQYAIFKARPDFERNAVLANQPALKHVIGGFYILIDIETGNIRLTAAGYIRRLQQWYVKVFPSPPLIHEIPQTVIEPSFDEPQSQEEPSESGSMKQFFSNIFTKIFGKQ